MVVGFCYVGLESILEEEGEVEARGPKMIKLEYGCLFAIDPDRENWRRRSGRGRLSSTLRSIIV